MVISLIELTPPPCNGFGAPVFQTLGGGDKNGVGGKGLGTRLVRIYRCGAVQYSHALNSRILDKMATSSTRESVRRRNIRTSSVKSILQSLHKEFLDLPMKDLVPHLFQEDIIRFELKQRINSRDISLKEVNDLLFDHLYSSRADEESLLQLCDIMDDSENKHIPPAVRDFSKTLRSALNKSSESPPSHHTLSIEPPDSEKSRDGFPRDYVPDRNEDFGSKESYGDDRVS